MKKLIITLLLIFPFLLGAQSFTPNSFTASAVGAIKDGAKVRLKKGTYKMTSKILKALAKKSKKNVSFTGQGGKVTWKSSNKNQPRVKFTKWKKLVFKNITFVNIEIQLIDCSNATIEKCTFTGQKYSKPLGKKDREYSLRVLKGSKNVVKNCKFTWTHKDPGSAIKTNGGKNFKFLNNTMKGRMKNCMTMITDKKSSTNVNPVTNHLVSGGSITTSLSRPELVKFEDHGLYLHNISNVVVNGVTFKGWTARKGGYGIKLKGVKRIEVKKNKFVSPGIIISEAKNWRNVNDHIWIHNNTFNGAGIHSSNKFDSNTINNSCLIEKNTFKNGIVEMKDEKAANVNKKNALAGKPGGVHRNCTKKAFKLKSGIKASKNSSNGCKKTENSKLDNGLLEIDLFPNPIGTDKQLTISYISKLGDDTLQVRIFNYLGQKVMDSSKKIVSGSNQIFINPSDLSKGIYLVKMNSAQGEVIKKLMVR